jgi:hypothetical protein
MFKVGQKVVCIDAKPRIVDRYGNILPIEGEIYTIRKVIEWGVFLVEIVNKPQWYDDPGTKKLIFTETCFMADRFRPIDYTFGEQVCESLEVMTEPELV